MKISRVGLAVIGDEVLLGEIADENINLIAGEIARIGADLAYASVLPDNLDFLVRHLAWMMGEFDWVVSTGGIGTTHDDLTREAVSAITGKGLREDAGIIRYLEERLGPPVPDRLRKLAMIPEGARIVENPRTGVPGFSIDNLIVLPGIPKLIQSMMVVLAEILDGVPFQKREIRSHLSESRIAQYLEQIQEENHDVKIGSYPQSETPGCKVKIVLRSRDRGALGKVERLVRERVQQRSGEEL
jgi:molybdenum cofactor synthesis domain-containing protein